LKRLETTDVVTAVTVTMKYKEQSAVPYLVGKAEALTAGGSSISTLKIDLDLEFLSQVDIHTAKAVVSIAGCSLKYAICC
jgi:hypothetical protein